MALVSLVCGCTAHRIVGSEAPPHKEPAAPRSAPGSVRLGDRSAGPTQVHETKEWRDFDRSFYAAISAALNQILSRQDVKEEVAAELRQMHTEALRAESVARIEVQRDGKVTQVEFETPSKLKALDGIVARAVRGAILPPLPDTFLGDREWIDTRFIVEFPSDASATGVVGHGGS